MARRVLLFCPRCERETLTRRKRVSKRASDGWSFDTLPDKCLVCGYLHGSARVAQKKSRTVHISHR